MIQELPHSKLENSVQANVASPITPPEIAAKYASCERLRTVDAATMKASGLNRRMISAGANPSTGICLVPNWPRLAIKAEPVRIAGQKKSVVSNVFLNGIESCTLLTEDHHCF